MPNHFSTLGMPLRSPQEFQILAQRAARTATAMTYANGHYLRWKSPDGGQLWLQLDRQHRCIGMTPYFAGKGRLRVVITHPIQRVSHSPLEGAFYGWPDLGEASATGRSYPFVFDLVDFSRYAQASYPLRGTVRLAAFAQELQIHAAEAAFQGAHPGLAIESLIPAGLFSSTGDAITTPDATAILTGRVLESRSCCNPLTGGNYHWLLLKTAGGTIDLVADPALVPQAIVGGEIVSGAFWLYGQLVDYSERLELAS